MKTARLFLLIIGWLVHNPMVQSQPTRLAFYPRQYVVKVWLTTQSGTERGVLYDLTDSTIVLAPMEWSKSSMKTMIRQYGESLPSTESLRQDLPLRTYRYTDIGQLALHRRGSVAKGFLIGAGVGAIGTGIGLIVLKDFHFDLSGSQPRSTATDKALAMISTMAVTGVPGLLIGAATTKRIDGKRHSLSIEAKKRFRDYTIVEQVNRARLYAR